MPTDQLSHHPRLRRPAAVIGWVAGLYVVTTIPLAVGLFDEAWRHPMEGRTWDFMPTWGFPLF